MHGARYRGHVVDGGRASVHTRLRRKGRFETRIRPQTFKRIHQRRFLTADISARTSVQNHVEVKVGAKNPLAQNARFVGILNRFIKPFVSEVILSADVEHALGRADGVTGNHHALEQLMGVILHKVAVFTRARLAFVGVAGDKALPLVHRRHKRPFESGRKARPAPSAQTGLFHLVYNLTRFHIEGLFGSFVATVFLIKVKRVGIFHPHIFVHHHFKALVGAAGNRFGFVGYCWHKRQAFRLSGFQAFSFH